MEKFFQIDKDLYKQQKVKNIHQQYGTVKTKNPKTQMENRSKHAKTLGHRQLLGLLITDSSYARTIFVEVYH